MMELPSFRVARYRFDLEAIDPLHLPLYKGSTFRGGFGYAFKKMVCSQPNWRTCNPCVRGNDCPYGYIFETTVPADSEVLRSLRELPVPFILEPPVDDKRFYQPGERLSFDLVLIGRAINYLPYFLLAFQEVGRNGIGNPRGRYILHRILNLHPWRSTSELVYDGVEIRVGGRDLSISNIDVLQRSEEVATNQLVLHFLTPTRLKYRKEIVDFPEFHILIRNLTRRLSSLAYFHCGDLWNTDFRGLNEEAGRVQASRNGVKWLDWERYSGRQNKRINLGGFAGEVTYDGDLETFIPLLITGEIVHVGKGTVFGNGMYRIML